MNADIGVVIVTYNRQEELKKTLRLFDRQILAPRYVLVVNNASTDGTGELLESWLNQSDNRYQRILITSETNEGGAGGFYRGLEKSLELDAEWVWVSDDDAYPFTDTIEKAQEYLDSIRDSWDNYSAVCAGVLTEGGWNVFHRRNITCENGQIHNNFISAEVYDKESSFEINAFSYVGSIINRGKLKEAGLTNKEYFIYYDDTEHSLRLHHFGKIMCVPSIRVFHFDAAEQTGPGQRWKLYYRIRNQYDMYRRHMPEAVYYRYYLGLYRRTIVQLIKNRHSIEAKITKQALDDLRHRRFGRNEIYFPGAVIEDE